MFDKEKRYVTCGIDQRLPQDLQRLIWTSVDARILFSDEKIDYLQVFTFKKIDGEILALHHEQEQPPNRVLIEKFDEVRNAKAIPAIISKSLFDKVQAILDGRTVCRPQLNKHPEYILTGFLYCKACGSTMSGESNIGGRNKTRTRTYVCPKRKSKARKGL